MPKYQPNSRFSDCWSSVGNVTFYHRNGKCFYKTKPVCKFTGTTDQMRATAIHQHALECWRTLSHDVQLQWNEYAKEVPPHRPPFDGSGHITGHNLFVSAYHGFAQLGNEHIPCPEKWKLFPIFFLELLSVEVETESLVLRIKSNIHNPGQSAYRLHLKLQLTNCGSGVRPGMMRTFIAEENCTEEHYTATFIISDFRSRWELASGSLDAFCRFTLIDCKSGYRSQYQNRKFENLVISE